MMVYLFFLLCRRIEIINWSEMVALDRTFRTMESISISLHRSAISKTLDSEIWGLRGIGLRKTNTYRTKETSSKYKFYIELVNKNWAKRSTKNRNTS